MAVVKNSDFRVSGQVKAGNIASGIASITPVANTPTSVAVTGLSLKGTGTVVALATAVTSLPGTEVQETSMSSPSATGITLWIYRTNTTVTKVGWFMFRKRA